MRARARTFFRLVSTSRGRNPGAVVAAANIRGRDPAAVLLCPTREVRGIRSEIKKPTYSARARTYICPPRGRTPVLLRPARAEVGGGRGVRPDSKNVCARTHLVPPRVRIPWQRGVSHANEKDIAIKTEKELARRTSRCLCPAFCRCRVLMVVV